MGSLIYRQKQNHRWNIECISLIFWNDHDFGENSERKVIIVTKELNLKKQELAKGIKELTLKVLFALVSSVKVDKLLYRKENLIYGSIPNTE